ncbi:MAG: FAD-binding oxidoreductase [Deltaproteobacteria bacterium]|nr:FAD-binding oxidoreductase [Deltaproteobacteria bacterium]
MIPRLTPYNQLKESYHQFLDSLPGSGFEGEIKKDMGTRLVSATDNSVYHLLPQAVVFPKSTWDVKVLLTLLGESRFKRIKVSPRGGGTGTNGQSLTEGIIIDLSKYMNRILETNPKEGWVRVQPGVVLDQLNDSLATDQYFFAPTVSTSSRATLGGMINTDASGKGSLVYGKTSDHILELTVLLVGGKELVTKKISLEELANFQNKSFKHSEIYSGVDAILSNKQELIKKRLPKLKRFLTGYNLEKIYSDQRDSFNLSYLLSGSEGTLGIITEAKLKLTRPKKYKKLLLIKYGRFEDALTAAEIMSKAEPIAIETIDDNILALAKKDPIYHEIKEMIKEDLKLPIKAINLLEFASDNLKTLDSKISALRKHIESQLGKKGEAIGDYLTDKPDEIKSLWELRKKGVGLLGNKQGNRKPIAFVEDTAVPPEHLAAYIRDFKKLLDSHGLEYGMFGHIDVGCLHVRPALDMKNADDENKLLDISAKVVKLVQKYGGVMWAEHGKGFRSEYTVDFFGEELHEELRRIKRIFDPDNQLNPGKIVTPLGSSEETVKVDGPFRGHRDRQIIPELLSKFESSVNCNGNGACFNYSLDEVICPSAKHTRDRVHSPKGRASLLREWIRLLSTDETAPEEFISNNGGACHHPPLGSFLGKLKNTLSNLMGEYDYSNEVYEAMMGCLACKACATQCPIKVDVPDLRALFLELYHSRYLRPVKDHLLANIENTAMLQSYLPGLFNQLQRSKPVVEITRLLGFVDAPKLSENTLSQGLNQRGLYKWNASDLRQMKSPDKRKSVILLQDAFTSFYESGLVLKAYDLLKLLGVKVFVMPFFENGKALHIKGFLESFNHLAHKNAEKLSRVAHLKIPFVGIDPAVTLTYRDEYPKALKKERLSFPVLLFQEWLLTYLTDLDLKKYPLRLKDGSEKRLYRLFGHCTEKSLVPDALEKWQRIFELFGLNLSIEKTGCCGMSGVYGHEKAHSEESKNIYRQNWQSKILQQQKQSQILVTGFSCRSQVKRVDSLLVRHPLEALLESLSASGTL